MNSIKKFLRIQAKRVLVFLTNWTIKKHNHQIIIVTGLGQTGLEREAIYQMINQEFPARRNLETPESEFYIPLVVIGAANYPDTVITWLLFFLKTCLSLLKGRICQNKLVIELPNTNKEIFLFWSKLLSGEVLVVCEEDTKEYEGICPVLFQVPVRKNTIEEYFLTAKQVARYFSVSDKSINQAIQQFKPPQPKISILQVSGITIIDNSYLFLPIPFKAILEVAEKIGKRLVFIVDRPKEAKLARAAKTRPINVSKSLRGLEKISSSDTFIIRTRRATANEIYKKIAKTVVV